MPAEEISNKVGKYVIRNYKKRRDDEPNETLEKVVYHKPALHWD